LSPEFTARRGLNPLCILITIPVKKLRVWFNRLDAYKEDLSSFGLQEFGVSSLLKFLDLSEFKQGSFRVKKLE
jgi:hypothetical protein